MDIGLYLLRIGYQGPIEASLDVLRHLHHRHLLSVPFESLSIHCGEPIILDLPLLYDKIIQRHRGGFCFELNGLFLWLLQAFGFDAKGMAGRVRNRFTGRYGPPLDHMVISVQLDKHRYLCDVGFGEAFTEPLELKSDVEQIQEGGIFWLGLGEGIWVLERREESGKQGRALYQFTLEEKKLGDFAGMCLYHQTSPMSIFTCKSFCSLHTEDGGRLTYMGWRLISSKGKERTQTLLKSSEIPIILEKQFGIKLERAFTPKDEEILLSAEGDL